MSSASLRLRKEVIELGGAITFQNVMSILQEGLTLMQDLQSITIEFSQLLSSDSSVLALLTAWTRVAEEQGKSIFFVKAPPFIRDVARVYGLDSVLPISWEN